MSTPKSPPNDLVLFLAFAGEEIGLLGSSHWVNNPTLKLDAAVGAVGMGFDLALQPVDGWIARFPKSFGRAGIFGEIEIDVNGAQSADGSAFNRFARVNERGEKIAVPHQEFDVVLFDGFDQAIAFRKLGRHWFVLHDMQSGVGGPDA